MGMKLQKLLAVKGMITASAFPMVIMECVPNSRNCVPYSRNCVPFGSESLAPDVVPAP